MVSKKTIKEAERQREIEELKRILHPGDTVFTKVNHVSASGMFRCISLYIFRDNEPRMLDYAASVITGYKLSRKHEGVEIGGCGMDMGFALVHSLSDYLYGNGYPCIGYHCNSNHHRNSRSPELEYEPMIHQDGYALKQRWL